MQPGNEFCLYAAQAVLLRQSAGIRAAARGIDCCIEARRRAAKFHQLHPIRDARAIVLDAFDASAGAQADRAHDLEFAPHGGDARFERTGAQAPSATPPMAMRLMMSKLTISGVLVYF
jgi:hypothetical protein